MTRLAALWRPAATALAALLATGLILAALGYAPERALLSLFEGSLGSRAGWTATLLKSAPLLLTGLAVALSFRAGVWNIGAEGQLLVGALAATALATRSALAVIGPGALLATLAFGALAGAAWAAVAGVLRAKRGVNEVISTILLNFVAIQLVALAVHGPLQEAAGAYPQSDPLPAAARLPAWGRVHVGVALAFALAIGAHTLLFRTGAGFRMRAVGLAERASRFAGIPSDRVRLGALTLAGGLAGLAGACEVAGVTERLYEGLSAGTGYTAIAVALLARLQPLAVVPAALFFGALEAGSGALQRDAGVPSVVTEIVQGLVILFSVGVAFTPRARTRIDAPRTLVEGPG